MATLAATLQSEISVYRGLQAEYEASIVSRSALESQLKENEQVSQEFKLLSDESVIYKMIGPCLVKQDKPEAISNVSKRIEFIQGEIKRSEVLIAGLQDKQEKKKMEVVKLETAYQQQVAANA